MARRLKDYSDVRRYLASLINRVEADEITPEKAGRLTYISNVLLRAIECGHLEELDKRLMALEAREDGDENRY
jgi:hypothetical protein